MDTLTTKTEELLSSAIQYADEFEQLYVNSSVVFDNCFDKIKNQAIITIEVLGVYIDFWKRNLIREEDINEMSLENEDRILLVTKALFIFTISAIEFNIRQIIANNSTHPLIECINRKEKLIEYFNPIYDSLPEDIKEKFKPFKKKLTDTPPLDAIRRIVDKSKLIDLITDSEINQWIFILEVRNITVHNDLIGSKDMNIEIDNRKFTIRE